MADTPWIELSILACSYHGYQLPLPASGMIAQDAYLNIQSSKIPDHDDLFELVQPEQQQ